MKARPPVSEEGVRQWQAMAGSDSALAEAQRNMQLYAWWSDDLQREALYGHLRQVFGSDCIPFPSRARRAPGPGGAPLDPPGHHEAYLLMGEAALEALQHPEAFLNAPYRGLSERPLVLAQDGDAHAKARRRLLGVLRAILPTQGEVDILARAAVQAACVLPFQQREFDLALLAREAALRFFVLLWGIPSPALPYLLQAFDGAYRALNFLLVARHFEPFSEAKAREAREAIDKVSAFLNQCIDAYRQHRPHADPVPPDAPELVQQLHTVVGTARQIGQPLGGAPGPLAEFVPMLARLADLGRPGLAGAAEEPPTQDLLPPLQGDDLSSKDLAGLVVEMLGGAIGQIQSGVCHAMRQGQGEDPSGRAAFEAFKAALASPQGSKDALVALLARDPPAPILARWRVKLPAVKEPALSAAFKDVPDGAECLIATATLPQVAVKGQASGAFQGREAALSWARVFGLNPHRCPGPDAGEAPGSPADLALPVVRELLRQMTGLVGLNDAYHPVTQEPLGLSQTWGSVCERYPLQHDPAARIKHGPLCVRWPVKVPVAEHAAQIKLILQYGAPRIVQSLNRTGIVHVAWFQLVDEDRTLLLNTVFDGDMAAYLRVFANLEFPVFDALFEHLETPPPTPVKHFQREFVEAVMRHHVPPALDFFYSAYPGTTIAQVPGSAWAQAAGQAVGQA